MKSNNAALFPKLSFHHHHLIPGDFRGAVHAADIPLFLGFIVLGGVVHHISQILHFIRGKCGFVRVGGIVHHLPEIALHLPNRRGRHQISSIFAGTVTASWSVRKAPSSSR